MPTEEGARLRSHTLIVDDDEGTREMLASLFAREGHRCDVAADGHSALEVVDKLAPDVVICDVRMDGMSGLELLDHFNRTHPGIPFIVITGLGDIRDAVDAIKRGAFEYVTKPCDPHQLLRIVSGALDERRRREDQSAVRRAKPAAPTLRADILGEGPAMQLLRKRVAMVAASSATVLITGETGSGKELVARAIHAEGPRRNQPFVAVNTSAIPQELLEGEVFGHVRGAFSGALQSRKGLLTEADGGTLLLDEIGDMPLGLQAKLLRVLQLGEVRPVGSDRTHHVDVRVIAATHRDLPALVRGGKFREDLYFRLNVLPVVVPPLRDRREDIPALAAHFLAEARRRTPQSPVKTIGPDVLQTLTRAPWPGNVRELGNAIERAVVFGSNEVLEMDGSEPPAVDAAVPRCGASRPPWPSESEPPWTLRRLNQTYTQWVLAQTGGDKRRAAEIMGIDLSTLYRRQRERSD
jgi:two-component system response regulator HydG